MLDIKMKGTLSGIKVLDFGHYYAGPMVGMMLADQGANVIRIVQPGKKELSGAQLRLLNRNKKLLPLDLKTPKGQEEALALIEKADVLIENFRPGVMQKLGLDYASVKERNPQLIYLSLPGFASTDKERAGIQAWEGILGAASGMYTENFPLRNQLNLPPLFTPFPQCSAHGAMHGAVSVMAAIIHRQTHGQGACIEVPLVAAGMSGFPFSFVLDQGELRTLEKKPTTVPESLMSFVAEKGDAQPVLQEKLKNAKEQTALPLMTFYPCADNRMIFLWAPGPPKFTRGLLKALGLYKELQQEGFVQNGVWDPGLTNNLDEHWALTPEKKAYLVKRVAQVLSTKTTQEWTRILNRADISFGIVRTRSEWLALEPMMKSGVFACMDDGKSTLTVPGRIVDMTAPGDKLPEVHVKEADDITPEKAHNLFGHKSQHTQVKKGQPEIAKGDLLKGLKVLDLSNVMAGPTSTYTLAQYGADVVRSDPSTHLHPTLIPFMLEIMQGKRSLLAELGTAPGQQVLHALVKWADVVMHNVLDDTAVRLGISQKQLKAINPDIVSCQLSCFGGSYRGGWEQRPGFDPSATAEGGIIASSGTPNDPYSLGHGAAADMMGGLSLAFSALLGKYQKDQTGYAGEGRASLVRACNYFQLPFMISENGKVDEQSEHGQFVTGIHAGQRLYACSDDWIYVGVPESDIGHLMKTVTGAHDTSEALLEETFRSASSDSWLEALRQSGIAAHKVMTAADIVEQGVTDVTNESGMDSTDKSFAVYRWAEHPCGKPVMLPAPSWVRVGEAHSYKRLTPTARLGEHSREVLIEAGFTEKEIAELARLKVVHDFLPALGDDKAFFFEPK